MRGRAYSSNEDVTAVELLGHEHGHIAERRRIRHQEIDLRRGDVGHIGRHAANADAGRTEARRELSVDEVGVGPGARGGGEVGAEDRRPICGGGFSDCAEHSDAATQRNAHRDMIGNTP